jgi:hypothetical protein
MNVIAVIAGSIVLGGAAAFMGVQIVIFLSALIISIIGFMKERRFHTKFFLVWLKSVAGILVCLIVFGLGDHIFRKILGFSYDILDPFIFWAVLCLTLLGFVFHVARKVKRTYDIVSTPEFDSFHAVQMSKEGIDDYVKKNLELLRLLQDGEDK